MYCICVMYIHIYVYITTCISIFISIRYRYKTGTTCNYSRQVTKLNQFDLLAYCLKMIPKEHVNINKGFIHLNIIIYTISMGKKIRTNYLQY